MLDLASAQMALVDGLTSSSTLQEIAQSYPQFWLQVAKHPNASFELLSWLEAQGDEPTQLVIAKRRADATSSISEWQISTRPSFVAPPPPETKSPPVAAQLKAIPVVPAMGRGHILWIGLVATIAVVIMGLVAWFVVVPVLRNQESTQGFQPQQPVSSAQSQPSDFMTEPSWQLVATADTSVGFGEAQILDTTLPGHVIIASDIAASDLQDINLGTGQVTWSIGSANNCYFYPRGNSALLLDDSVQLAMIDLRTGLEQNNNYSPMNIFPYYVGGNFTITQTNDGAGLCARELSDLTDCIWQSSDGYSPDAPVVFGGGKWMNTTAHVLDVRTGEPASFGSDSKFNTDGTYYVYYASGPGGPVLRFQGDGGYDPDGQGDTVQIWNTSTDRGMHPVIRLKGALVRDSYDVPVLLASLPDDASGSSALSAYSWTTTGFLWQMRLPWRTIFPAAQSLGSLLYVNEDGLMNDDGTYTTSYQAVIDATTGKLLWHGQDDVLVGNGSRVAYFADSETLYGYAYTASSFDPIWSIDFPSDDSKVGISGGHVLAVSPSTGQVWQLV